MGENWIQEEDAEAERQGERYESDTWLRLLVGAWEARALLSRLPPNRADPLKAARTIP